MTSKPTVFVVDDDRSVVEAVVELVELLDLNARSYYSAEDFLEEHEPTGPACLVLDFRMPGMSGLELQKELARTGKTLPVIMITGHGDVSVAVEAMKAGAVDFLEKPFRMRQLSDAIQMAIRLDSDRRHLRQQRKSAHPRFQDLTPAEHELMDLIIAGKTNNMIAQQLGLSTGAVEDRRAGIMKKLGVQSRAALLELTATTESL